MKRKKKPACQLSGEDGNIYMVLARAQRALRKAGMKEEANELRERIFKGDAHNYDEALAIIQEYVEAN